MTNPPPPVARLSTCLCLLLALVWPASPLGAQTAGVPTGPLVASACVSDDGLGRDAAELCGHVNVRLGQIDGMRLADVDKVLGSSDGLDPRAAIGGLVEMIEDGQRAFKSGDIPGALRSVRRALEGLVPLEPWLKERIVLQRALALVLDARATQGDPPGELEEAAKRLLTIGAAPLKKATDLITTAAAEEALERAAQALQTDPPGQVEVQSTVPQSEVFIDGVFVGVTPLRLGDIPAGDHIVRVRRTGYKPAVQLIRTQASERAYVDLVLEPMSNLGAYDSAMVQLQLEAGLPRGGQGMDDLRALLFIDQLVVLRVRREGTQVQVEASLYDLGSLQQLASTVRPLSDGSTAARRSLAAVLLDDLLQTINLDVSGSGGPALWNEWWFWTGVGAVALTAITVVVILNVESEPPPTTGGIELQFE